MKGKDVKLGDLLRDTVTGYEGTAVAKTEWMNGCWRITLQSKNMHEGRPVETYTVDAEQCVVVVAEKARAARPSGGERQNVVRASDPK